MFVKILAIYYIRLVIVITAIEVPTIKIPSGIIQGSYDKSYDGRTFMAFLGVPYAKPPIGHLRFEEPQPIGKWSGVWIANTTSVCLQVLHYFEPPGGISLGEEDCLHLNIYVPQCEKCKNMDVIVHIHGGAYVCGNAYDYSKPKYLMDRDVILVGMNYRVGVLGFLSTEDKYLPGNLGMKDQVLALKWIQDNIVHFGGNPKSVTITGASSGASSVQFHYLSPLSKGLFVRGVSSSGSALNSWALMEKALEKTRFIAKTVGCNINSTQEMVRCLKSRPGKQLNEAIRLLRVWLFSPAVPLALVIDKWSENPFLPEHPYKMLVEGKVFDAPLIFSTTTSEGLYPAAEFPLNNNYLPTLNENWYLYAPAIMHYIETAPQDKNISLKIKQKYLGDKPIDNSTFPQLVQLLGDRIVVYDVDLAARLQARATKSPVYYYQFDYLAEKTPSLMYFITNSTIKYGVGHIDDMASIFSFSFTQDLPRMSRTDEKIKNFLLDIWRNFAATGDPGIEWTPVNGTVGAELNYLYINTTQEMRKIKEFGHRSFWESLNLKENKNYIFL